MRRMSQPSGRWTLMVSCAPNCTASAAVCVWVSRNATTSACGRATLGVVSDAPAAVFSVTVTTQLVRSAYGLHAPSSWSLKLKSQSAPLCIVDEVWTATIIFCASGASNFPHCRSTRSQAVRHQATLWMRSHRHGSAVFRGGSLELH